MKKSFVISALTLLLCAGAAAQSSNVVEKAKYFVPVESMPDAVNLLPWYPEPGSAAFLADSVCYEEGKALRDTPRGKAAVEDASTSVKHVMRRFGESVGLEFNADDFPVTADFIYRTMATARLSITNAKKTYNRQRPYQHFHEGTPVPSSERPDDFTSYPSGHTIRFWIAALTMSAIAPQYQNEFLKAGYEMGQSRVIIGFHYQSDVDAARLVASACFARMCADENWRASLAEASEEFNAILAARSAGTAR